MTLTEWQLPQLFHFNFMHKYIRCFFPSLVLSLPCFWPLNFDSSLIRLNGCQQIFSSFPTSFLFLFREGFVGVEYSVTHHPCLFVGLQHRKTCVPGNSLVLSKHRQGVTVAWPRRSGFTCRAAWVHASPESTGSSALLVSGAKQCWAGVWSPTPVPPIDLLQLCWSLSGSLVLTLGNFSSLGFF